MQKLIVGVDETGRGSCIGPVVCCAVAFRPSADQIVLGQLADSKTLSPSRREVLSDLLVPASHYAFGAASAAEVDCLNPRQATLLAMRRAVLRLEVQAELILIDGKDCPGGLPCEAEAVVKGDQKIPEISAASILAKVFRDRLMMRLAARYPDYGLERNAGYGTRAHFDAILKFGATRHHRKSFLRKLHMSSAVS